MVSPYLKIVFGRTVFKVFGSVAVTASTSIINLYAQRPPLNVRKSACWYSAGAILSAGHIPFVPIIAPSVKGLADDMHEKDSNYAFPSGFVSMPSGW